MFPQEIFIIFFFSLFRGCATKGLSKFGLLITSFYGRGNINSGYTATSHAPPIQIRLSVEDTFVLIWHYAQSDTWHILTRTKIKFSLRNTHLRAFKQHAKRPLPSLSIAFVRFCQVKLDQNIYRILRYALAKSLLSHSLHPRPRQSMNKIFYA